MQTNQSTGQRDLLRTPLTPYERGFLQGIDLGYRCGIQGSIIAVLSHRFSKLPFGICRGLFGVCDTQKLNRLLEAALTVDSP